MYTLSIAPLAPPKFIIIPLFPFNLLILKPAVGGKHCPLTDGTENCPKNNKYY